MKLAMQMIKKTETEIKREIKNYLDMTEWFNFPIVQGLGCYKGLPDIIACKDGITLFIEVKTAEGKQTIWQQRFEERIRRAKGHYIIVRCVGDIIDYLDSIARKA